MFDSNVLSPEVLEFLAGIMTGFLAKKGEDILGKFTDRTSESLKKILGKDEVEKIKDLTKSDAEKKLKKLVSDKNLRKEVHTFYVIYKYLERFTAGSVFLRVMDFRMGEGLPLDRTYAKLQVVEEKKEKEREIEASKFYGEDYYYRVKERWEREEPFRRIDPDDIISMNKGLVCIIGLPGAGKTTLCKYFCWKTLEGEYAKKGLPIYIELRGIRKDEDPVTSAFHSQLKEQFTREEIEEAVVTIKHNTELFLPLFIFDGLDEVKVDPGAILESIRNCANSALCIVTSRRSGFIYMQHDKTYEILPLGLEEKKGFVKNYFKGEKGKIDSFLRILEKKEYKSVSKNPLLLSILCALASDEEDMRNLPSRKSGLYKRIVVKMNEWYKSKGGRELSQEEKRNLEDLALNLFLKKRPKILFEKSANESTLDKAAEVGIIHRWDELRYSFLHLTLQEYFAARALKSLKRKEWEKIIRRRKDAVVWHEIIQLFASILNEEGEYEELKHLILLVLESPDILHLNYGLAGNCLAEIDMDDIDGSEDILRDIMCEFEKSVCKNSFIEALANLGDKSVEPLIDLIQRTDDNNLKLNILFALFRIGDSKAIEPLIDLLEKTDDYCLKVNVSFTLAETGGRAADVLLDLIQGTNDIKLKAIISLALAGIGDSRAIEPLIDLLEKTDKYELKMTISNALTRIGNETIEPLIDLLEKTDDDELKAIISFTLARTGNETIEPLIDLLEKTDDRYLKMNILFALTMMGDSRAIEPLIDLLEKTDSYRLKVKILYTLARTGNKAVNSFVDLSEETDDDELKAIISDALARIGYSEAVEPLIDLLEKTDDDELKTNISDALAKIGSEAVEPLIDLLEKTDDDELKAIISFTLGQIRDSRAIEPLMNLLQETDKDLLKMSIVHTFSKIGGKAVDILMNLMQVSDDNFLKITILFALAGIGDSRAVEPLMDLLEKTDDNKLKVTISDALIRTRDPRAIEPLIDLLEKTDDNKLRREISDSLRYCNPLLLYPFIENQILRCAITTILCFFSTKFNMRFFEDKIVLPEGEVLYIGTEHQREQSIKRLDRIIEF